MAASQTFYSLKKNSIIIQNFSGNVTVPSVVMPYYVDRYTKEAGNKKKASLSYEVDPSVIMLSAAWGRKNLEAVHKAWLVNLSARLVSVDLSGNQIRDLPDELLNILPALETLDISSNQLEYLPEVSSSFIRYICKFVGERNT